MFDWKYHVTSLAAVFLALGLGILIGAVMLPDDALVEEQQQLVASLEENFRLLRQENEAAQQQVTALSEEITGYRDHLATALPVLARGRLEGRTLGIINASDYEVPAPLFELLAAAGASVYAVTGFNFPQQPGDAQWLAAAREVLAEDLTSPAATMETLGRALGQALHQGQEGGFLEAAANAGLVQTRGELPGPVDAVILVEGANSNNAGGEPLALSLSDYFIRNHVPVLVVEPSAAAFSFAGSHRSRQLVTIPGIDTPLGQLKLLLVLAGP